MRSLRSIGNVSSENIFGARQHRSALMREAARSVRMHKCRARLGLESQQLAAAVVVEDSLSSIQTLVIQVQEHCQLGPHTSTERIRLINMLSKALPSSVPVQA